MDEPRHVGAPAPAEPKIPREAEEQGATAEAEPAVSPGADPVPEFATDPAAVSPAEVEGEGNRKAAPAAVGEGCLAGPTPEPEAAAEPEPRVAVPPHPAEPEPQAAEAVSAEGAPQPAEAVAVAEAGPEPVAVVVVAEAAEAAAAEPDVRMPEAAEAVAEAEPRRGLTPRRHDREMHATTDARGLTGLTPFADFGAGIPPAQAEPAGTQAAPRAPEPEAPPWRQAGEASAAPVLRPQEPPARPVPTRLPPSLPSRETVFAYLRLAGRAAAAVVAGFVGIVLSLVVLYRWVDPPVSTLMLGQRLAGTPIERTWVPLERISPHLVKAVVLSEDGGFCRHRGVDWTALAEAMESARGGSTITMQVVKNLFLWPSRSYVRKAIEIALAWLVELVWPKRRILEIYLNIAEWGDGVFGAEAAARWHFGKSAAQLTAAEAALLAVALPNPTERMAGSPSPAMSRLARRLMVRMTASRASLSCVRTAPRLSRQAHLFRAGD